MQQAMSEYLKKKKNLPWHLRTYTSGQEMLRQEKGAGEYACGCGEYL